MEVKYVPSRSELTELLNKYSGEGFTCYRVKTGCKCRPIIKNPERNLVANQRNAVLVLKGDSVAKLLIKCKVCSKKVQRK